MPRTTSLQLDWRHPGQAALLKGLDDLDTGSMTKPVRKAKRASVTTHAPSSSTSAATAALAWGNPLAAMPRLTRNGRACLAQRGIKREQLLGVLEYGCEQATRGMSRFFMTRQARDELARQAPDLARQVKSLDILVVCDGDVVVTASHRTARVRLDSNGARPRSRQRRYVHR